MGPRIRLAVSNAQPIPASSLIPVGRAVTGAVTSAVGADLGEDTSDLGAGATRGALDDWTRQTALRIAEAEAAQVEAALAAADAAADAGEDAIKAASAALDSAETRAALLARDAVGDLTAEITSTRAQELGSEWFVWRTRQDERVRSRHVDLEGTEWRWSAPPADQGLPGEPPNCRCWAQALPVGTVGQPTATPAPAPPPPPPPTPAPVPEPVPALPSQAPPPPPVTASTAPDLSTARRVDLFGGQSEAEATQAIARALGQPLTPADVVGLAGVDDLTGVSVSMRSDGPNRIGLSLVGPGYTLERSYSLRADGLYAYHEFFQLDRALRDAGLGRDIFGRQVDALREAGFQAVETKAAGGPGQPLVGYYVWPRLGFDAPIPAGLLTTLPAELSSATQLSDLMASAAGRDWWRANGTAVEVAFDLDPDSRASQVLEAYLAATRTDATRADGTGRGREDDPIVLTPDDEALLDRIWARLTPRGG